jgi:hypothetical protein
MQRIASPGRQVTLRTDPTQDLYDRYDRLLAYVDTPKGLLQSKMLTTGWAEVYVYEKTRSSALPAFARALPVPSVRGAACGAGAERTSIAGFGRLSRRLGRESMQRYTGSADWRVRYCGNFQGRWTSQAIQGAGTYDLTAKRTRCRFARWPSSPAISEGAYNKPA